MWNPILGCKGAIDLYTETGSPYMESALPEFTGKKGKSNPEIM
jgi:hypothetical protein